MAEKYAAIDCGTNSVRLLVAEVDDERLVEVDRRLHITRLGQGNHSTVKSVGHGVLAGSYHRARGSGSAVLRGWPSA